MTFPLVPIGEVVSGVSRPTAVEPGVAYRTLGVKWWGEGAYERQTLDGGTIRARTLFLVRDGDLIFNKIWARHGSSALIPPEMDGCVASSEFPTFETDRVRVVRGWLEFLFRTPWFWEQCEAKSRGTGGKNRIKPAQYLSIGIPLPGIEEQDRVVNFLREAQSNLQKLRQLHSEIGTALDAFLPSVLDSTFKGGLR